MEAQGVLNRLLDLNHLDESNHLVLQQDIVLVVRMNTHIGILKYLEKHPSIDNTLRMRGLKEALVRDCFYCQSGVYWDHYLDWAEFNIKMALCELQEIERNLRAMNLNDLFLLRMRFKEEGLLDKMYKRYLR